MTPREVVIIGASGGIGGALAQHFVQAPSVTRLHLTARNPVDMNEAFDVEKVTAHPLNLTDEDSIRALAERVSAPDLVIVASGLLSRKTDDIHPEKSYRQQDLRAFEEVFAVNTFGPALVAKHLLDRLPRDRPATFAALCARVGSIGDNRLGGWHAYRSSKAALNMLMRNYAIEMNRRNPQSICVTLHPGTVATELSAPFRSAITAENLFPVERAAAELLQVLARLGPSDSGHQFDWQGARIPE